MYVFTLNTIGEKLTRLSSKQILKKDACVYVHTRVHTYTWRVLSSLPQFILTNFKGPAKLVLVIKCSYQDLQTMYAYTTTADQILNAQNVVCVNEFLLYVP